jgi:hypothetical protein
MFQAYTIVVQKEEMNKINQQAYNLINTAGYTRLVKTDFENANEVVYFLLEDVDYYDALKFQDNILIIAVNEIEDYGKKFIKK